MASTLDDFWRMVWQQRSTTVVMLGDLQENGLVGATVLSVDVQI